VFATIEVSTGELAPGWRMLGFVDAGWLGNNNANAAVGKPVSDQLVGAGLGLRYAGGAYGFSLDWAQIVTGSVLPLIPGSGTPQAGDQKIHLNLSARF
jgi:hemolysin activation/secretion protein